MGKSAAAQHKNGSQPEKSGISDRSAAKWPAETVTRRPISDLVPYARNARTHSPEQIEALSASMKQWGWTNPVLVDEAGGIIAGHGRVLAAQSLEMAEVPVMVAVGWTDAQKRAYVIADNQLSIGGAGWDADLLAAELDALRDLKFDLSMMGFAPGELNELIGTPNTGFDPDEVPPAPVVPVSRTGDLWLLGNQHRLLCGDSTKADDVARLMGGAKADAIVTDPPYGMNLDTDWSGIRGTVQSLGFKKSVKGKAYPAVIGDDAPFDPAPFLSLIAQGVKEVFLFGPDYYAERIPDRDAGSWLVWDKRKPSQSDGFGSEFELIWSRQRHKKRVLRHEWFGFLREAEHGEPRSHPTQKPVTLIVDIIEQWCEGKIIADPFCGSGTTLIACERLGRSCYGIEIAPVYSDVSVIRWQTATGKHATLDGDGRTFEEVKRERTQEDTERIAPDRGQSVEASA